MAQLVKMNGYNDPSIMTVEYALENINNEVYQRLVFAAINLNIVINEDGSYEWDSLVLPDFALENISNAPDDIKRDVLIAHIIKGYYDDNKMTAIQNNYLLDPEDTESKAEFLKMQNVRKVAKDAAKYIVANRLF